MKSVSQTSNLGVRGSNPFRRASFLHFPCESPRRPGYIFCGGAKWPLDSTNLKHIKLTGRPREACILAGRLAGHVSLLKGGIDDSEFGVQATANPHLAETTTIGNNRSNQRAFDRGSPPTRP